MRKGKQRSEWGPETSVEWMLKSKGLSNAKIRFLIESKDRIGQCWDWDEKGTKSFPINTASALSEIAGKLKGLRPRKHRRRSRQRAIVLKVANRLSDILPERTVQDVHEYLHEEPFREALAELSSADTLSQALSRIRETIDHALYVHREGYDTLPKPRGNWLHRQLLDTLKSAAPGKFSDRDMAKLFDYFCPCGTEHNREAMKKFRWRLARAHG